VIYLIGGYSRYDAFTQAGLYNNDVWASMTGGKTWVSINKRAAFQPRGDSQVEITSTGVIVILGGVTSKVAGQEDDRLVVNDVWASLDGGYSWGQCSDNADWSDRRFQMTLFDSDGYAYVMGGRELVNASTRQQLNNDVWRSVYSYSDPLLVAENCHLTIPSCGPGLRCWPTDNNFQQGLWGVSCDACPFASTLPGVSPTPSPTPSSSSSSTMSPALIGLLVFLGLFLVTLLALLYTYYRLRATGISSPIPLPSSAERWWNKGSANTGAGSIGLVDTQQKDTSDALYNPLTIRDAL